MRWAVSTLTAPTDRLRRIAAALLAGAGLAAARCAGAAELMIEQVTDLAFDVHPPSRTIVFSALGQIWRVPQDGGLATAITSPTLVLDRPRLSPDGTHVGRHALWLVPIAGGSARELTVAPGRHGDADWHPDGTTLVFSSDRGRGRDLWTIRVDDGTERQLTFDAGDAYDPSWDTGGGAVLYASAGRDGHAIRRIDAAGRTSLLVARDRPVHAPRRRPDGVAIVFHESGSDGVDTLQLLLPVAERAVKPLLRAADLEAEPVAWHGRDHFFVARDGRLYEQELAGPRAHRIPITAFISVAEPGRVESATPTAPLSAGAAAAPALILRVPRVFDPASGRYLLDHDVHIASGRIIEVVPRRDWPNGNVLSFPDSTLLPGLIDTTLRSGADTGAARLAGGVTAVAVAPGDAAPAEDGSPAPARLTVDFADVRGIDGHAARIQAIIAARDAGLQVISDRLLPDLRYGVSTLDAAALPVVDGSPAPRYADIAGLLRVSGTSVRGGYRVAATPAADWRATRIARALAPDDDTPPAALAPALDVLAGFAAGQPVAELLRGLTVEAAAAAGRRDVGRIGAGARADLVLVPGDPLADPVVLLEPIAVVRDGRLHSVAGLLEQAAKRRDTLQSRAK